MAKHLRLLVLLLVGALVLSACGKNGPEPIALGSDCCSNCGMIVSDAKFGAELITRKGKLLKFDSVECLAGFLNKKGPGAEVSSLWVVNLARPSELIDATRAFYLQSGELHSPMGLNVAAFRDREAAVLMQGRHPGSILTWPAVLKYVGQKWG